MSRVPATSRMRTRFTSSAATPFVRSAFAHVEISPGRAERGRWSGQLELPSIEPVHRDVDRVRRLESRQIGNRHDQIVDRRPHRRHELGLRGVARITDDIVDDHEADAALVFSADSELPAGPSRRTSIPQGPQT